MSAKQWAKVGGHEIHLSFSIVWLFVGLSKLSSSCQFNHVEPLMTKLDYLMSRLTIVGRR